MILIREALRLVALLAAGTSLPPGMPAPPVDLAMNPHLSPGQCASGATRIELRPPSASTNLQGSFSGDVDSNAFFQSPCVGFVPRTPQFCVIVRGAGDYIFTVTDAGGTDAVLALHQPGTGLLVCDDDSAGNLLPWVSTRLDPGEYDLYVGSYSGGYGGTFVLSALGSQSGTY